MLLPQLFVGLSLVILLHGFYSPLCYRNHRAKEKSTGTKVIKLFFILNSAEHEIYPAHKC